GARCQPELRRFEDVLHAVVHHEHIGAWPRGDVAVRSMHGIAVEEHHGARLASHGANAALLNQELQAEWVRHSVLLPAQRLLVMFFWRFSYARNEVFVRARNDHERTILGDVVGKQHRTAERTHPRHAILDVPGLEVGMPVELFPLEAWL